MLQMGNIVKNPKIWIAPTVASMITGPIATVVFQMTNIPAGSGMGTCEMCIRDSPQSALNETGILHYI